MPVGGIHGGWSVLDPHAPRLPHRPGLDGLRAVAVLTVLVYHLEAPWFDGGFLGVEVFFTLSGYLVTGLLLVESQHQGRVRLRRFALARARRLVPALIVCLLGTTVAVALVAPGTALRDHVLASLLYVQNWHLIAADIPYAAGFGAPPPLLHLWSLAIEGQLYLVWALVLLAGLALVSRKRFLAVVGALAALSVLAMAMLFDPGSPGRAYFGSDTRASGFLIGAALAIAWTGRDAGSRGWRWHGWAGAVGLTGLLAAFALVSEFDEGLYRRGGFGAIGLLSALVVAAAADPSTRVARLLSAPPLVWIGQRSYGLYLYHWPIIVLTAPLPGPALLVDALRVAATVAVTVASYRWVETPIRRRQVRLPRPDAVLIGTAIAVVLLLLGTSVGTAAGVNRSQSVFGRAQPLLVRSGSGSARPPEPAWEAVAAQGPPVIVVGDSVMLGSTTALRQALGAETVVDAVVGRQFAAAPPIVAGWAARNPGPVVVHLGSNGTIDPDDVDAVMSGAGDRLVVLVNVAVPRRWQQPDNATIVDAASRYGGRIRVVDWAGMVARSPQLLGRDRVHPTPEGRTALAEAVRAGLGR